MQEELKELEEAISSIPAEIINIDQVRDEHKNKKEELKDCQAENKDLIKTLKSKKELYEKISSFESEFDIEEYKEKNELIEEKLKAIENIENEIRHHEQELEYEEKKAELEKLGISVVAASVDPADKAQEVATEVSFPVGMEVGREIADALGSWWEDRRQIIQPSEFILGEDNKVLASSYADGPLGRMQAGDVIQLINFYESR